MLKSEARKLFRKKRDGISQADKLKWDDLLLIQLQAIQLPFLNCILNFYPIEQNNEVDTFLIADFLKFRNPNLTICYPKTNLSDCTMSAMICEADTIFEANRYNIPEPVSFDTAAAADLDLVIIPMLAFDESGNRVGYGKGFYDRYLKDCREDCLRIGVSYFEAIDRIDDADEFDVPLDLCITPQRSYVF